MNLKNKVQIISLILFSGFLFSACTNEYSETNIDMSKKNTNNSALQNPTADPTAIPIISEIPVSSDSSVKKTDESLISIKTKDGEIIAKLYKKDAPNTVANFIKKVDSSFYDGLIFHRFDPGFVIQGGDPLGNGTGGGDIKSEINNIPFVRGSIGLARGGNIEISNDSQFYICLSTQTCSQLTGQYVNFGEVISGLDVVDKVRKGDEIISITSKK